MPLKSKNVLSTALQRTKESEEKSDLSKLSEVERGIADKYIKLGYDVALDERGKLKFSKGGVVANKRSDAVSDNISTGLAVNGRIPLPDYKNPESRLDYAKQFTEKYGPLVAKRGDTPLRINEKPAWGSDTSKNLAIRAAKDTGLDPAVLYASAMEEGMSGLYPHKIKGHENEGNLVWSSGNKDYPISGFESFGLDTFSDAYPGLVKKGYLPQDFEQRFTLDKQKNEKDELVNSAIFKTADDALLAKAAMMRDTQDSLDDYVKQNNINLSSEGRDFFNLVAYNAGLGNAQKMLQSYNQSGFLKNDDYLKQRPSESWKQPYENVQRRIQMANALKKEGYFDDQKMEQMKAALQKTSPATM